MVAWGTDASKLARREAVRWIPYAALAERWTAGSVFRGRASVERARADAGGASVGAARGAPRRGSVGASRRTGGGARPRAETHAAERARSPRRSSVRGGAARAGGLFLGGLFLDGLFLRQSCTDRAGARTRQASARAHS